MNPATIRIALDSPARHYAPGAQMTGRFFVDDVHHPPVKAAELSVLWYTAGKGEEDLAVHFFERVTGEGNPRIDLRTPRRFMTVLPASPLSYEGVIVKVCWCVRLRLFLQRGQEVVREIPFRLGNVQGDADER